MKSRKLQVVVYPEVRFDGIEVVMRWCREMAAARAIGDAEIGQVRTWCGASMRNPRGGVEAEAGLDNLNGLGRENSELKGKLL